MIIKLRPLIAGLGACAFLLGAVSCEKKSPIEEAAEDIGDAVGDAAEDVGDAIEDATN